MRRLLLAASLASLGAGLTLHAPLRRRPPSRRASTAEGTPPASSELRELCYAQLEATAGAVEGIDRAVVYLRAEAPGGALEFSPIAVWPETKRVFVVSSEDGALPGLPGGRSAPLVGWADAKSLLPQYPFAASANVSDVAEDGALAVRLVHPKHEGVVLGVLAAWLVPAPGPDGAAAPSAREWTAVERAALEAAGRALALAAVLDQRQQYALAMQSEQLRVLLSETLHQVKNPLTALRTFGKLLLRTLPADGESGALGGGPSPPPGLGSREVARDIIMQADRAIELLSPVDAVVAALSADDALLPPPLSLPGGAAAGGDLDVCWVEEVVAPILGASRAIAEANGIDLVVSFDDDLPGVLCRGRWLQEALSNIIDNALKYVTVGFAPTPGNLRPRVELRLGEWTSAADGRCLGVAIQVADNGQGLSDDDVSNILGHGVRGAASTGGDAPLGQGLGLAIADSLMRQMGGELEAAGADAALGGAVFTLRLSRPRRTSV